ncbi:type IV pilus assembly protein FimV [Pseudomonas sp. NPDC089530]|uniref:type IV pilus assembly protein FimV n=1 Tax=Pseudomonas sp. NPDC089530 TaxID=3390651 RepID=UPI003D052219
MFQSPLAALRGSVRLLGLGAALSLASALYSSLASAVGLGEITVHSALNQPLEAEIALEQAQGLREDELSVSLATAEEFKQAGVEPLPFLDDLRFTPILQGERRVIRVASSKPVNEPFLDFLLQVNQANGRQLREYMLLIDPPGSPEIVPAPAPVREVTGSELAMASQAPAKVLDPVAGQLAQTMRANQQLQNQAQELQNKLQLRDEQLARQQQQLGELQRRLAEVQSKPTGTPAPVSEAPATPAAASPPQAAVPAPKVEGANPWLMVAALLLSVLLVLLVTRRRRQAATLAGAPVAAQMPSDSRPSRAQASAVTTVAAGAPLRSTPPVTPIQPPATEDRRAAREPSFDVDWDLIAPAEPARVPAPPAVVSPPPFDADSIVWRLEEPDEPPPAPKPSGAAGIRRSGPD